MAVGVLDLHDSNLQLWHADSRVQSPGYALLQGKEYVFGAPARAIARLQPRDINTRYWWRLSTEALQPALGPARHTGDLVHSHLRQLHQEASQPAEVLLAVPGSMAREQLSLLLGIVQQCPFDAVGLVNRSVALGSLFGQHERLFHLEIQLHQALVSELITKDNSVELKGSTPLPGCGLLQLQERLVEIIAAEFVRQTRFDPRRQAATEQQLYDTLPGVLRALQEGVETNLDVNGYQARISAQQLEAAGQRLFESAGESIGVLNTNDRVIADPLAALLPGTTAAFKQLDILQTDDIYRAVRLHQEQLTQRGQALSFVSALPILQEGVIPATQPTETAPVAMPSAPVEEPAARPTHLLDGHIARLLVASGTDLSDGGSLYLSAEGWQLRGADASAQVNGREYLSGQTLNTGDTIAIGGGDEAVLIEVLT
jgi:hypothetical protein